MAPVEARMRAANALVFCAAALAMATCGPRAVAESVVRREGAVEVTARVTAERFARRTLGMPGYHLVVWSSGGAASAALFQSAASDLEVLDALEALGARPSDALGMESWEHRHDERSSAPDRHLTGPPVEVLVRVPGRAAPLALADLLVDGGGRGFDMRLGGHRANVPVWHSGCVVCLYSCPGSKVGNAAYTVRDYVRDAQRFQVRPGVLPADGSEVVIVLRPRASAPIVGHAPG